MARVAELLADGEARTGADLAPAFAGMEDRHRRATLGRFVQLGWLDRLPARRGEPAHRLRYQIGSSDAWRRGAVERLPAHVDPCDLTHKAVATVALSLQLQRRARRVPRADRRHIVRMAEGAADLAVQLLVRALDHDAELRAAIVPAGGRA
jgi:hypothetical protein